MGQEGVYPLRRSSDLRLSDLRLPGGLALLTVAVMAAVWQSHTPKPPLRNYPGYEDIGSPDLAPLHAMYAVPRAKYGFTPLPQHTTVEIERQSGKSAKAAGYDVLLHIYPAANDQFLIERTVSFQFVRNRYQWTGEQETWTGPRQYTLPDGSTTHETISISYAAQPGFGAGVINTLQIEYAGDDPRLSGRQNLGLKDIQPVLKQWGAI